MADGKAPSAANRVPQASRGKAAAALEKRSKFGLREKWYLQEDPEKATRIANARLLRYRANDQRRIYDYEHWSKLYGTGFLGGGSGSLTHRQVTTRTRIANPYAASFNGIQSTTDSVTALVGQHKPVAQFTATDGNWTSHQIAKLRARYIAGWFYEEEAYQKGQICFRDSSVWADGICRVWAQNNRARISRAFPGNIYVNQVECIDGGTPREMGQVRLIDRHEAHEMYEGNTAGQEAILRAPNAYVQVDGFADEDDDLILFNEMWRLPSAPDADDGRFLVATEDLPVEWSQYRHPNFPFAIMQCTPSMEGFWSQGLAEQLENLQLEYGDLSYSANEAIDIAGRLKLWVDDNSQVDVEAIDNEPGSMLRGTKPPVSLLWQAVQPEVWQRLDKIEQLFFLQSGANSTAAGGGAPTNDESGLALRLRLDVYSQRFAIRVLNYQQWFLTLAKLGIQCVSDILAARKEIDDDDDGSYFVRSVGSISEPIDFKDLAFRPGEQFTVTCVPINDLPDTIEGRTALAQEFVANGYYDEYTAREVFLFADTVRVETLFNAQYEYIQKTLDAIVEKGKDGYRSPEVTDNLALMLQKAQQHLSYAKERDVAEDRCDLLRRFILEVKNMIKQQKADMAPPVQAPQAQPLGVPAAAPVSKLLPVPTAAPPTTQAA